MKQSHRLAAEKVSDPNLRTQKRSRPSPPAVSPAEILKAARKKAERDRWVNELAIKIRLAGLPEPLREFKFHPTRRWRFDFCWPSPIADDVAVEVHGAVWSGGRHTRGWGFVHDREKMNEALCMGYRVLEVVPEQIKDGSAVRWLERLLGRS